MGKIEQNKKKKRLEILMSAQKIFLSDGYMLSSMDKIAAHAQMTKQTLYRYFPSKLELFRATLVHIGGKYDDSYVAYLENPDIKEALFGFAKDFLQFHLSDEYIATYRLLIVGASQAPEVTNSFLSVGPIDTDLKLSAFFSKRLKIKKPEKIIHLWLGMLLSLRSEVLIGVVNPNKQQIEEHSREATEFLLAAMPKSNCQNL